MATKKTTKSKSTKTSSTKAGKDYSAKQRPQQVDPPIIIKGGSVSLSFGDFNFTEDLSKPVPSCRTFNHEFGPRLRLLRIFRGGRIFQETPLEQNDTIVICYAGSRCPTTL